MTDITEYKDNYKILKTNLFRLGLFLVFLYCLFQLYNSFYWFGAVIDLTLLFFTCYIKHEKIILTNTTINFKDVALLPLLSENNVFDLKNIDKVEADGIMTTQFDLIEDVLPYDITKFGPNDTNYVVLTFRDNSTRSIPVDINLGTVRQLVKDLHDRLNGT